MSGDKKSSCDFTRPLSAAEKKSGGPAHRNAQYYLTGTGYIEDVGLKEPEIIGSWLDLQTARGLWEDLSKLVGQFYPGAHFYSCPSFGMELRLPAFEKNGTARVGDLILRPFSTTPVEHQNGTKAFIETHIAGYVSEVNRTGHPVELRDRTGLLKVDQKKPYFVFNAVQFNLSGAMDELQRRDEHFLVERQYGVLGGCYEHPKSLSFVLREFLRPEQRVLPSKDDISRIMGCEVGEDLLSKYSDESVQVVAAAVVQRSFNLGSVVMIDDGALDRIAARRTSPQS